MLAAAAALVCWCGADGLFSQVVQLTVAVLLTALLIAAVLTGNDVDDGDGLPVEAVEAVGVGSGGRR